MDTISGSRVHDRLVRIETTLSPATMRASAIAELDEMFRAGSAPEPEPEGFLRGRLITMSVALPSDAFVRAVAQAYMPWLGKAFDPAAHSGVNVLSPSARRPMKLLWPRYEPERELLDRIEAFPFRTRIEMGAVDPGVKVLKIDYDLEGNPGFLIRRILDELVQIEENLYLGKILFRRGSGYKPIGFFSLEK